MSALGSCGCVSLHAIYLRGFEGWSVSLLILVGEAMDILCSSNATVRPRVYRFQRFFTFTVIVRACQRLNRCPLLSLDT